MTSKKRSQAKSTVTLSFHFTVLPVENGYRLHVSYGEQEYMWPDLYGNLEQAGKQILQALRLPRKVEERYQRVRLPQGDFSSSPSR